MALVTVRYRYGLDGSYTTRLVSSTFQRQTSQCQQRNTEKNARHTADFRAREDAEDHQDRMQRHPAAHQFRADQIILDQPENAQKQSYPPEMRIAAQRAHNQ